MDDETSSTTPVDALASGSRAGQGSAPVKKQVQLVGAPPVYHGAGRKEEPPRGAQSDDDDDDVEDEEQAEGSESFKQEEEKARTVAEGELKDEDLLAEFDEDADVSSQTRPVHVMARKSTAEVVDLPESILNYHPLLPLRLSCTDHSLDSSTLNDEVSSQDVSVQIQQNAQGSLFATE
jgi:hypothetical protein